MSDLEPGDRNRIDDTAGRDPRLIATGETLRTTVGLVDALVDECRIHLDRDGLGIRAADPALVASVDLELGPDAFASYRGAGETIGVDLERLGEIVGWADRDQPVEFDLDVATRTVDIAIGELAYSLALVDPDAIRSPPDPADLTLEFDGEVVLDAAALDRMVRAADLVSDHLALGIDVDSDTFYMTAAGDTDDVSVTLAADDLVEFEPGEAHSLFSVDYLADVVRALPRDARLRLRLGTEQPLALGCELDDAGTVEYLVSPRIASQ